jgi:hypothetical protein
MQFANSSDADHITDADPFMAMIQPSTTWLTEYRICTPAETDFAENYINLIATSQALLDSTLINGTLVAAWNPADINKGLLPSGPVFARIRLKPATAYFIDGRSPLGLTAYGFSEYDSYGYPGGMRFTDTSPPIITCPEQVAISCNSVAGAVACVAPAPDLTLKADFFDDCTPEGHLVITQTPKAGELLQPGTYPVTITAADAKGNKAQCVVTLIVEPKWTQQQFGAVVIANPALEATVWGANADPDQDGMSNDLEQAVGSNANQKSALTGLLELSTGNAQGSDFLMISLPRLVLSGGPIVELEAVPALDGSPWQSGPDLFEELPGNTVPLPGGKYEKASFKARHTDGGVREYYLRLKLKP